MDQFILFDKVNVTLFSELKALAYKALACATKYNPKLEPTFVRDMKSLENSLHEKYNETEGHFGNVYTTSLAVQVSRCCCLKFKILD